MSQFGIRQLLISSRADHTREEIASAAGLSLAIASALCLCGVAAGAILSRETGSEALRVPSRLIVRSFLEEIGFLEMPVLERVDGRSALEP